MLKGGLRLVARTLIGKRNGFMEIAKFPGYVKARRIECAQIMRSIGPRTAING